MSVASFFLINCCMKKILSGKILVAEPFFKDPNFGRSIILMCEHSDAGSIGFTLQNKSAYTLEGLLESAEGLDIPVFIGGPVEQNVLHFIHQMPDKIPNSDYVTDSICWGGDLSIAIQVLQKDPSLQSKIKFFLGYAGWGSGQLAEEIKLKTWFLANSNPCLIFNTPYDSVWKNSLPLLGKDYEWMLNAPSDPLLN